MFTYVAIWLALGCISALFHLYAVRVSEKEGEVTKDEYDWLVTVTPMFVIFGPLSIAFQIYILFFAEDE